MFDCEDNALLTSFQNTSTTAAFGKNSEIECWIKLKTAQAVRQILPVLCCPRNRSTLRLRTGVGLLLTFRAGQPWLRDPLIEIG